jgi:mannosyltransferase
MGRRRREERSKAAEPAPAASSWWDWAPWIALGAVLALAAALRLWGLGRESIWWDEAYSLDWASHDIPWILDKLSDLNHPPLYFILLGGWGQVFGDGVVAARAFTALVGVAGVGAAYLLGRAMFRPAVGIVFALLVAVADFHIYYSQDIRNYTLLFATSVLSMHAYWRFWHGEGDRRWALAYYAIATLAMLYSHFAAVYVVAAQLLHRAGVLMARPDRKEFMWWVGSQAAAGLLFLPWLPNYLSWGASISGGGFWVPEPTFAMQRGAPDYSIVGTFYQFIGGPMRAWLLWLLVLNALVASRLAGFNRERNPDDSERREYPAEKMLLLVAWLLCSLYLPFIQSLMTQPIYLSRLAIPALAPFLLLATVGIMRMANPLVKGLAVAAVVGLAVPGIADYYGAELKEPWDDAVALVERDAQAGAKVVIVSYMDKVNTFNVYQTRSDLDVVELGGTGPADIAKAVNETRGAADLWLVVSPNHGGDPRGLAQALGEGRQLAGQQLYQPPALPRFVIAANPVWVVHWTAPPASA